MSIRVYNPKEVFDILTGLAHVEYTFTCCSIQQPHYPQGEFLAYGVFYAIGQDVGVGEVGNLIERLVASATSKGMEII